MIRWFALSLLLSYSLESLGQRKDYSVYYNGDIKDASLHSQNGISVFISIGRNDTVSAEKYAMQYLKGFSNREYTNGLPMYVTCVYEVSGNKTAVRFFLNRQTVYNGEYMWYNHDVGIKLIPKLVHDYVSKYGRDDVILANETIEEPRNPLTIVEEGASFTGGVAAFYRWLASNMRYPQEAREKRIGGRIYVDFVVNEDGTISNIKILRGLGAGCDEEAIRLVKASSGMWTPGRQRGHAVAQRMVQPVNFKLPE